MSSLAILLMTAPAQAQTDPCRTATEAYSRGDIGGAEQPLEECVRQNPDELTWYLRLCAVYQQLGRREGLYQAALQGLRRFPSERRFYVTAGVEAAKRGDWDTAVEVLSAACERWPDDSDFHSNLLEALKLRGMKNFDESRYEQAEADFRRALEIAPNDVEALLNLGRLCHNLLRSGEALTAFERVAELAPDTPLIQFHRGVALHALRREDEAIQALTRQLESEAYPAAYYFRGLAFRSLGRLEEALEDLNRATSLMPDYKDAHFERGRCLVQLERFEQAEKAFRSGLKIAPDDARMLFNLGQALIELGRRDEARPLLKKAGREYSVMVSEDQDDFKFRSTRGSRD